MGLVGPRIDLNEGLPPVHHLTFAVTNLTNYTGDLADDGIRINRSDGADSVEVNTDVALFCGRDGEGNRPANGAAPAGGSHRRRLAVVQGPPEKQAKGEQDKKPDQYANRAGAVGRG